MNIELSRPAPSGGGDAPSDRRLHVIPGGLPDVRPAGDSASRRPRPFSLQDASSSLQTSPLSLLIVDDHAMFRQGLSTVIREIAPHATIAEAGTCAEALDLLGAGCPFSIILLDLSFGTGPTGLLAIDVIRERCAATPIAVVSGLDDTETMLGAIDHGAMGFIPKTSTVDILFHAMALVLAGQSYFPIDAVRRGLARTPAPAPPVSAQRPGPAGIAAWNLTPRECEVLAIILQGKANKVIAAELGIHNEDTVRKHVSSILRKASVRTRTQLVLKWFELMHGQ
jgi:DNA-binding NarL/FixJ family response regulator